MANTHVQNAVLAILFPKNWNKKKRNTKRPEMMYDSLFNSLHK